MTGAGGGFQSGTGLGIFKVTNTLLSSNLAPTGPECAGVTVSSGGHNLLTDQTDCNGFGAPGDVFPGSARLGKLGNHGGPTQTIALKKHSPAINHGGSGCPKRDQRGQRRSGRCDIGAYEFKPKRRHRRHHHRHH